MVRTHLLASVLLRRCRPALVGMASVAGVLCGLPLAAQGPRAAPPGPRPAAASSTSQMPPDIGVTVVNRSRGNVPGRPANARPGDVLEYRLVLRNRDRAPLRNVTLANPIPAGAEYVDQSARMTRGQAPVEFAKTRGGPFAPVPLDTVRAPDGTTVVQPLAAAKIGAVRWVLVAPLAPGDSVQAVLQMIVKGR